MLPELERVVNEDPEYHALRAVFLWRVVSQWYRAGGGITGGSREGVPRPAAGGDPTS